jgi:hypothetical protein
MGELVVRRARTRAALAALALSASACGFVQRATTDGEGVSAETLTAWIATAEELRSTNQPLSEDWLRERELWNHVEFEESRETCGFRSWDEVLGCLHARRSSAVVRDVTYVSLAGTAYTMILSPKAGTIDGPGDVIGVTCWTILSGLLVPIDVVIAPFWFGHGVVCDLGVSHDDLVQSATDLQRARELGWRMTRIDGPGGIGWPYPSHLHIDQLGYDAAWLQRQR